MAKAFLTGRKARSAFDHRWKFILKRFVDLLR